MKAQTIYLAYSTDYTDQAQRCESKASAIRAFRFTAKELDRNGLHIEASLHYAETLSEITEYPDYVLSLGPRGGVKVERA